ncbi:flagellar motor switch protein FliG [bacterium]|nr:flagellar motor switch protein FliG [bacterium]
MDDFSKLSGSKKAAMFFILLGEERSGEVFKHLTEDEIRDVTKEITFIEHIDPTTMDTLLEEFNQMHIAQRWIAKGGIDYAKTLLMKSLGPESARRIIERLTSTFESSTGFASLKRVDPQQLVKLIQSEHPQTIALILAYLEPAQGAESLAALPDALQAEVAIRMTNLGEISPDVVQRISEILEEKLISLGQFTTEGFGGIRAVAEVFNRMERSTSKKILEAIENTDPSIVADIKNYMFVFDDIMLIDNSGIQEILKRIDKKVLATALKGTSEEMKDQFFKNMSSRAVELMKEEMDYMGPIRIKEVEIAQQEIVSIVRRLEEEGVVAIGGSEGEEFVV